jgi:hypothetical protein
MFRENNEIQFIGNQFTFLKKISLIKLKDTTDLNTNTNRCIQKESKLKIILGERGDTNTDMQIQTEHGAVFPL